MLEIKNKIEYEGNCWIGSIDPSNFNSSEKNRIKAVTDLASITTGRLGWESPKGMGAKEIVEGEDIKWTRRKSLYNRLLTESAGKPSVPFEFIPVMYNTKGYTQQFMNFTKPYQIQYYKYGTYTKDYLWLSNLRAEGLAGSDFNKSNEIKDFKTIVGQVPWKALIHLRTHRAFSFLVESSRNKRYLKNVEFWCPSWWKQHLVDNTKHQDSNTVKNLKLLIEAKDLKPEEATMELSDRRLVKFAMCAWEQDKNSWDNLFEVRGKGTGTQSITGVTVDNIKKIING